ncbi:hypothetical protein BDZ91DRAFT_154448 [Kalaharituber pfeilii]|nr:hypothetical protein BDZ91DRAFT_154448 [Kalaharituber pfeilii]
MLRSCFWICCLLLLPPSGCMDWVLASALTVVKGPYSLSCFSSFLLWVFLVSRGGIISSFSLLCAIVYSGAFKHHLLPPHGRGCCPTQSASQSSHTTPFLILLTSLETNFNTHTPFNRRQTTPKTTKKQLTAYDQWFFLKSKVVVIFFF